MSRLILHIGTHKTGSSAIQAWLSAERTSLRGQGIHYGATDRPPRPDLPKHNSLYRSLVHPSGDFDSEKAAILRDFQRSGCHTLVLSEEGLSEPYFARIGRIAELREQFEIEIICFLRRQDYFLESLWNQRCREGLETRSIRDYVAADHSRLLADYARKLAFWSDIGQVRAVAYDETLESSVAAFAKLIGLKHDTIRAVANPSPSMNCAAWCNVMNRWRIGYRPEKVIGLFRRDRRRHALGSRLRRDLLRDFAPANRNLARQFGIVFDDSMPEEPSEPLGWPNPLALLGAMLPAGAAGRG